MSSASFVNAVMDVRVDQGVFHVTFGETRPISTGGTDFVPLFRAVIPQDEAFGIFRFLTEKANTPPKKKTDSEAHKNIEINDEKKKTPVHDRKFVTPQSESPESQ